ncbi:MAG: glutamate racemase [Clostridia bacterium]|nr:glutamate racemase [Clostridia bacterium]
MIGIFDSGVGGLASYNEARRLLPSEDIIYLADSKNAPYGTKDKETIIKLVKSNIKMLKERGSKKILIACCTASSIYSSLSREEQKIAVPIIIPAVYEALSSGSRITTVSTSYTASSHAFKEAAAALCKSAEVTEIAAQILVELVECGARDGGLLPRESAILDGICAKIRDTSPDSLILGCTHFSHLEGEFALRLPTVKIVNAALIGARVLVSSITDSAHESGKTIYI